jgi:hypothetical protein
MKAIEFTVIDSQTDKRIKSTFDAGMIVGVQEFNRLGLNGSLCTLSTGQAFPVEESYESLRKRWLQARDDQELVLTEPAKKLSVV